MKSFKDVAVEAAKRAGSLLDSRLGRIKRLHFKGVGDLVTEMDLRSERIILAEIRRHFPDHSYLAEEKGAHLGPSAYRWVIDPLDGTTNYAHGFPFFAVSIALEKEGDLILGVVYDPTRDELFHAEKGKGARLNGRKIHVSATPKLSLSLLATGFPYDLRDDPVNNLDHFQNFSMKAQAVRRA
jgi:myo-inositol-1(or 4)-monophosphatase